ncbi:MAG: hypothetical protein IPL33_03960 [Sphingobacteriales bacterium]|nr:hypothetical protein [Sphingobacteriales bacterium]
MSLKKQLKSFGLSQVAPPQTGLFPLMLLERTGAVLGMGGRFSAVGSAIHELFVGNTEVESSTFFNKPAKIANIEISRMSKTSVGASADLSELLKGLKSAAEVEAALQIALQREGELVFMATDVEQYQANLEAIGKFMNGHELDKTSPNYLKLRSGDLYMVSTTMSAADMQYGKSATNTQSIGVNTSIANANVDIDHTTNKKPNFHTTMPPKKLHLVSKLCASNLKKTIFRLTTVHPKLRCVASAVLLNLITTTKTATMMYISSSSYLPSRCSEHRQRLRGKN